MSDGQYPRTWKAYQAAWADTDDARRRELLEQSVAMECEYADPAGDARGLEDLTAYIGKFQQQFPGACFESDKFTTHNGQTLATWRRLDRKASPPKPGNSYARFGDDGKPAQMTGFPQRS